MRPQLTSRCPCAPPACCPARESPPLLTPAALLTRRSTVRPAGSGVWAALGSLVQLDEEEEDKRESTIGLALINLFRMTVRGGLLPFSANRAPMPSLRRTDRSLAIVDHISSVPAVRFPLEEIVRVCAERGVPVLVDAAHSIGQARAPAGAPARPSPAAPRTQAPAFRILVPPEPEWAVWRLPLTRPSSVGCVRCLIPAGQGGPEASGVDRGALLGVERPQVAPCAARRGGLLGFEAGAGPRRPHCDFGDAQDGGSGLGNPVPESARPVPAPVANGPRVTLAQRRDSRRQNHSGRPTTRRQRLVTVTVSMTRPPHPTSHPQLPVHGHAGLQRLLRPRRVPLVPGGGRRGGHRQPHQQPRPVRRAPPSCSRPTGGVLSSPVGLVPFVTRRAGIVTAHFLSAFDDLAGGRRTTWRQPGEQRRAVAGHCPVSPLAHRAALAPGPASVPAPPRKVLRPARPPPTSAYLRLHRSANLPRRPSCRTRWSAAGW